MSLDAVYGLVSDTSSVQGHVLRTPDSVATLMFEAAVHHLDMTVDLPGAPATGRVPLTDEDREELGELADRFPLTG